MLSGAMGMGYERTELDHTPFRGLLAFRHQHRCVVLLAFFPSRSLFWFYPSRLRIRPIQEGPEMSGNRAHLLEPIRAGLVIHPCPLLHFATGHTGMSTEPA
jgi:hypothetical protein